MLGCPHTKLIQSLCPAQQPDRRHHIAVQENIDDRVPTTGPHQSASVVPLIDSVGSHFSLPAVNFRPILACGAENFIIRIEDDYIATQEIMQRDRDTGDAAGSDGYPQEPLVNLLGSSDQTMLLSQVVDNARRCKGDGGMFREEGKLFDLVGLELVGARTIAIECSDHLTRRTQRNRQNRPVSLFSGNVGPHRIRFGINIDNRARLTAEERSTRGRTLPTIDIKTNGLTVVHVLDVFGWESARAHDFQVLASRVRNHDSTEVKIEEIARCRGDLIQQHLEVVTCIDRRCQDTNRREPPT
ncbi:hypothetical protein GCM10023197_45450 [Gordonia humi]